MDVDGSSESAGPVPVFVRFGAARSILVSTRTGFRQLVSSAIALPHLLCRTSNDNRPCLRGACASFRNKSNCGFHCVYRDGANRNHFLQHLPCPRPVTSLWSGISLASASGLADIPTPGGTCSSNGRAKRHSFSTHGMGVAGLVVFARTFVVGAPDCFCVCVLHRARDAWHRGALLHRFDRGFPVRAFDQVTLRVFPKYHRKTAPYWNSFWTPGNARVAASVASQYPLFLDFSSSAVDLLRCHGRAFHCLRTTAAERAATRNSQRRSNFVSTLPRSASLSDTGTQLSV